MKRRILGRTGLEVSLMGLGCGGHSRLGQTYGNTEQQSIEVIRTALDEGINYFDTAQVYQTEHLVGKALAEIPRESVVISTKLAPPRRSLFGRFSDRRYFEAGLHHSLRELKTDYIDVFNLHGTPYLRYAKARDHYVEHLLRMKEQGKIRFVGITEAWVSDPTHELLKQVVQDDLWDVIMVGLNFVNQSALETVFPKAMEKNLGIQIMYAVRRGLVDLPAVTDRVRQLVETGIIDPADLESLENPLGLLLEPEVAGSLTEAAYRFCAHVPGSQVVLSGTGNPEHLRSNARVLNFPPLPDRVLQQLSRIFHKVTQETCN